MARLMINGAGEAPSVFVIAAGETAIGRAAENALVLDGDGVSRRHARIFGDGSGFQIEDLGSKNGTLVNGEKLTAARRLSPGDVVTIPGWTLTFDSDDVTVTRSAGATGDQPPAARTLVLRPETREVLVRGAQVLLPPKEYLALTLLYERAGTVVSKEELAEHVWPEYRGDVSDYNIHQVISRLRRELEPDPAHPRLLITRPGFGYMLLP